MREINKIRNELNNEYQLKNEENQNTISEDLKRFGYGKADSRILLVGNKCEVDDNQLNVINDIYKLGLGKPTFISAEGGEGLPDLLGEIKEMLPPGYEDDYEEKKIKRMEKHVRLRKQLKDEII